MREILVSGGSGFIGSTLLKHPCFKNAIAVGRNQPKEFDCFIHFDFKTDKDYEKLFKGINYVVHLAGIAHIPDSNSDEFLTELFDINYKATLKFASASAQAKVKRFIYISSIKVLGESSDYGKKFKNTDPYNPMDNYAKSKVETEKALIELSHNTDMEIVIIRPPLVYGENAKGNFRKLINLVSFGVPLPLLSFKNKRSLVSVNNLIDLINTCLTHPKAKNQIFLVSDGKDLSTPQIISIISKAIKKNTFIFYFPLFLLKMIFFILGKKHYYERLNNSLQIDNTFTCKKLNWSPKYNIEDDLFFFLNPNEKLKL